MKKILALILSCTMFLSGCSLQGIVDTSSSEIVSETTVFIEPQTDEAEEITTESVTEAQTEVPTLIPSDTDSAEYAASLDFKTLDDPELLQYINDSIYSELESTFNSDDYIIENISSIYISKEYIEELEYNSQKNIFFGYTLAELEAQFQGEKYVFTLAENGETTVQTLEEYDDTYEKALKNIAIGTGVILVCVTVSVATSGAVSVVFAASAKEATTMALSSGLFAGVASGVVEGVKTKDFDKALKAAALYGSEAFKWGAISGAVEGGIGELFTIHNPGDIPNWRDSEDYVQKMYGGKKQVAFHQGDEVAVTFQNSTRPDIVREDVFEAIEVKNYDLESGFGSLCSVLKKQVADRVENLPDTYTQRIVLDARNRGYTTEFLESIKSDLSKYLSGVYDDIPIDILTNVGSRVITV